jgi:hypothetical protein
MNDATGSERDTLERLTHRTDVNAGTGQPTRLSHAQASPRAGSRPPASPRWSIRRLCGELGGEALVEQLHVGVDEAAKPVRPFPRSIVWAESPPERESGSPTTIVPTA